MVWLGHSLHTQGVSPVLHCGCHMELPALLHLPHPTGGWITQPVLHHQRRFSLLSTSTNGKELSEQQRQAQVRPQDHFCLQSSDFASPSVSPQCQPGCGHPGWCPRAQPGWPASGTALRGAAVAGQLLEGCLAMPAMILMTYSTAQI